MNRHWTEKEWLEYENRFLRTIRRHVGKNKAISATRLYEAVFGKPPRDAISGTRALRKIIEKLEWQGEIICSSTSQDRGGYYTPSTDSEIREHFRRKDQRALKILKKSATQKRVGVPEYLGQMILDIRGEGV